jgi:hypothetical protein
MTKKKLYGTVSWGTMRLQDLIPSFIQALEHFSYRKAKSFAREVPLEAWKDNDHPFWESDDAHWLIDNLFFALNDNAPEGHYFGAHPGDGSDLGFWPVEQQ